MSLYFYDRMNTMAFLVEWVKQIILFILIAIIIDLILPSNTLKKYIQLVVGLILILMFLKPVFMIFQIDVSNEIQKHITSFDEQIETDSINNLINLQKTDIQALTDAYILEEMTKQLIYEAEDPLLEEHSLEIREIVYYFQSNQERSYDSLDQMDVYVQSSEGNEEEVNTIEKVEEVIIRPNEQIVQPEENVESIIRTLKDVWEVHDKELNIIWGEGLS